MPCASCGVWATRPVWILTNSVAQAPCHCLCEACWLLLLCNRAALTLVDQPTALDRLRFLLRTHLLDLLALQRDIALEDSAVEGPADSIG